MTMERSLEEQVSERLGETESRRSIGDNNDRYIRLWGLRQIYRAISGEECGSVPLPHDVGDDLRLAEIQRRPIEAPGVMPGWGCCACEGREGMATYNGEKRTACKVCGHERCDRRVVH